MKSSIFSILLWIGSNALLNLGKTGTALSASAHMLRTLRGWAIAALIISLALRWLQEDRAAGSEPVSGQIRAAFSAFGLFSVLALMFITVRGYNQATWAATVVTILGGALARVMAMMALEFPDLRPRAVAAGAVIAGSLVSVVLIDTLASKPAPPPPGIIRTNQPADTVEEPLHSIGSSRA